MNEELEWLYDEICEHQEYADELRAELAQWRSKANMREAKIRFLEDEIEKLKGLQGTPI